MAGYCRTPFFAVAFATLAVVASAQCPTFTSGSAIGTVQSGSLDEISGVVASRNRPGVYWVHNDSGDSARIFALNTSGQVLGTFNLTGATALDWEDIAIGPGPMPGVDYLYVADIGDNNLARGRTWIYIVPEPDVDPSNSPARL